MKTLQSIWHVLTTPGTELLQEQKNNIFQSISSSIDELALAVTLISILLAIFGSQTAKKGAYWTVVFYFFAKVFLLTLA